MSWTDYALPSHSVSPPNPNQLLDFLGLIQAVQLIEHIRQENLIAKNDPDLPESEL
jgi:hypothetical protein